MEYIFGVVVLVGFGVSIFLLLFCLDRQRALHKRIKHLEQVMEQAVGPGLASRLREGGTAFVVSDRWSEDENY